jgi:molybdopterin-guanine dinucleotide biosynthesis protein A
VEWAAVVLSGGGATRLDGADKATLEHDGLTLLEHALRALAAASEVVVVGLTRESPPGGGPLAGVSAGAAALTGSPDLVVVLAVDMPHVTAETVARLVHAADEHDHDGAWLVDSAGRRQLAGAVRPALVPAPGDADGVPMRVLMQHDRTVDVVSLGHEADDVDTWSDVARLRSGRIDPTPRVDRT